MIIGRTTDEIEKFETEGIIKIGFDPDNNKTEYFLDINSPHVILICGKRGYGKSYTMGVILEGIADLMRSHPQFEKNLSVIVIDTMSVFTHLKEANIESSELSQLEKNNLDPTGFKNIRIFIPKGVQEIYDENELFYDSVFTIRPGELDSQDWLQTFKLKDTEPMGMLLTSVISKIQEDFPKGNYSLNILINTLDQYEDADFGVGANKLTKRALMQRFISAREWDIFAQMGTSIYEIAKPGQISVIDVSGYRQAAAEGIRTLIIAILAKQIYQKRVHFRRIEEFRRLRGDEVSSKISNTWMFIDEAHQFLPTRRINSSKIALREWLQQGRQPGLSLVLATQRPSAIDEMVHSQMDLLLSHRITSMNDLRALEQVTPTYQRNIIEKISTIKSKGKFIALDDRTETMNLVQAIPRRSHHGGRDSTVLDP